ncbi:ABC transporter substrate-binding protein [Actinomadura sp. NPDC049382]|uniref:ABC transporter substrate-binding protein n=1 Tax=Actinomadura sp. NPDC049382 TaxID=3158220 RepID=UPI003441F78D
MRLGRPGGGRPGRHGRELPPHRQELRGGREGGQGAHPRHDRQQCPAAVPVLARRPGPAGLAGREVPPGVLLRADPRGGRQGPVPHRPARLRRAPEDSTEAIIAQEPDLLLGLPEGVTRESLAAAGIPVLLEPSFCPDGIEDPGYETIYDQMRLYGTVFDRRAEAEQAVADLQKRIKTVEAGLTGQKGRKVAVLWPYRGEGTVGAYGSRSMATPQLETLGARNVFADVDKRVFEVSMEELLGRDPDTIVLLHTDGTDQEIEQALLDIPGAEDLRAVENDAVMVQLFNFTEPPTPLVLDGLERLAAHFKGE